MNETEQIAKKRTEKDTFYVAAQKNISLLSSFFGRCFDSPQSLKILSVCQKVNGNSSLIKCTSVGSYSVLIQKARKYIWENVGNEQSI